MAIAMPQRKESALDRVAKVLGVANAGLGMAATGYGLYKGIKQEGRESEAYEKAQALDAQEKDASSPLSQAAREGFSKVTGSPVADTVSAYQLKQQFGPLADYSKKAFETKQGLEADITKIHEKGAEDRKTEQAKLGDLTGDAAKLAKLSSADKQRYDNVIMANDAIRDMAAALGKGGSRYSLIGDNDYTFALRRFNEALGRMQSGGAIGSKEAAEFAAMARSLGDDPTMQAQKLQKLQGIMSDRFKTLGFDPSKNERFAYEVTVPKSNDPGSMIKEAQAGNGKYTPDDIAALQWAQNNKADPRAQAIVQSLRSRGL